MVRPILVIVGAGFILLGIVGFLAENFMGAHLTPTHNIIHLVSGAASLYFGLKASLPAAKLFAYGFGAFYLLLGVSGFAFGMTSTVTLPPETTHGGYNERMFRVIPGHFEVGTIDHTLHILIGLAYLVGAALTRRVNMTQYTEGNPE